jgi:hypothetical protein
MNDFLKESGESAEANCQILLTFLSISTDNKMRGRTLCFDQAPLNPQEARRACLRIYYPISRRT